MIIISLRYCRRLMRRYAYADADITIRYCLPPLRYAADFTPTMPDFTLRMRCCLL